MLDFENNRLFMDAPIAYSVLDVSGKQVAANHKFWQLFGRSELGVPSVSAITHEDSRPETATYLQALATGAQDAVTVEKQYLRSDGTPFWGRLTAHRLVTEEDVFILGVIEDIEEARNLEVQLREAAQAQSEFVARVSHELRNPLHTISGIAELFTTGEMEPEVQRHANIVLREAQNLTSIVSDLLDIGKFDSGSLAIDEAPFSIRKLVDRSIRGAQRAASERGLLLQATVDDALPIYAMGDAGRVGQVVDNMVGNALKFTSVGRVHVDVRAGSGDIVEFRVADTGPGVPADRQAEIFEPFQRLNPSAPGAGLGLAISARLATSMGGQLNLAESTAEGSTFLLALPLPATAAPAVQSQTRPDSGTKTSRILVVEDNRETQMLASAQLTRLGYEHDIADDGYQALERFERGSYGAILMDWHLPGIDGLETTRRIRQLEGREGRVRTPIISVTARAMAADVEACREAGSDDFVAKPASITRIGEVLSQWTGGSTPDDEETRAGGTSDAFATLLEELGDAGIVTSLANTFLQELPRRVAIIVDPASDHEAVQLASHTLKSTSAMVGAESLRAVAARIEELARDATPLSTVDRDALQTAATQTDTEVRDLVTRLEESSS